MFIYFLSFIYVLTHSLKQLLLPLISYRHFNTWKV